MKLISSLIVFIVSSFFSILSWAVNIDSDRYSLYFGDVNGDGFKDIYFHGKEQFVPIAGEIFVPLILPAGEGYVLYRNTHTATTTSSEFSEPCGYITKTYIETIANDSFSTPEAIQLTASDIAGFTPAVEGQHYITGDLNGDSATDFLLQNISDTGTNWQLSGGSDNYLYNCQSPTYTRNVVNRSLSLSIASTTGESAPQLLQMFTSTSFSTFDINTANISLVDIDGDGRDDIVHNAGENTTTWLAQESGQIDLTEYSLGSRSPESPIYTGTSGGEFRVSEAGSATYSMKIPIPVGTAGVQPEISVDYASNGNNGLLGKGWSISGLSSISRCRQTYAIDKQVTPIQWNEQDRFCLDGQRLIVTSGSYGSVGAKYRTELDTYAQIKSYGGSDGKPDYFKVLRKDGSVTYYGAEGSSQSEQVVGDGNVFSWAKSQVVDSAGNAINYLYRSDENGHRIEYVRYAYGDTSTHHAQIQFIYEGRPDIINGYLGGYFLQTGKRLQSIKVSNRTDSVLNNIRSFNFYYSPIQVKESTSGSQLALVQECVAQGCLEPTKFEWSEYAASGQYENRNDLGIQNTRDGGYSIHAQRQFDVNGDGILDTIILLKNNAYSYNDEYQYLEYDNTDEYVLRYYISDGEQVEQAMFTDNKNYYQFFDQKDDQRFSKGNSPSTVNFSVLDYNGDGKQDIAIYRSQVGYWQLHLSVPYGNDWRLSKTPIGLPILNNFNFGFADVDGDGLMDAVSPDRIYYLRLSPNPDAVPNAPYAYVEANRENMSLPYFGFFAYCWNDGGPSYAWTRYSMNQGVGDIDGDGSVELLVGKTDHCLTNHSYGTDTGSGSGYQVVEKVGSQWVTRYAFGSSHWNNHKILNMQLTDLNGDGLTDITYAKPGGTITVDNMKIGTRKHYFRLSNGINFSSEQYVGNFDVLSNLQFADVNNDGKRDLVWRNWRDKQKDPVQYRLFGETSIIPKTYTLIENITYFQTGSTRRSSIDNSDSYIFNDINNDKRLDIISFNLNGNETAFNLNIRQSVREALPPGMVTAITNGLGARTDIHYSAIGDTSAYTPADYELSYNYFPAPDNVVGRPVNCDGTSCSNDPDISEGSQLDLSMQQHVDIAQGYWDLPAGAQVLDSYDDLVPVLPVNGGIYVVTQVDSVSPAADHQNPENVNTGAVSSVAYQYSGARLQGGARGFLGFQYLKTIDLQTNIKTATLYRQDFPFTGAALRTATFAPNGQLMEEAINDWRFVRRAGNDGTFYYQTILDQAVEAGYYTATNESNESNGELTVSPNKIKSVTIDSDYDEHGNTLNIQTTTTGYGSGQLNHVASIDSTYGPGSISLLHWDETLSYAELGRLTSAVATTEYNNSTTSRATAFTYYSSGKKAGLLEKEIVEPNGSQNQTLTTTHYYSDLGNEIEIVTAGWDGEALVNRSARNEYDPTGRYVDRTYNHFNQLTSAVLERDERGAAVRIQNLAGITTTIETDALGREISRYDDSSNEAVTSAYLTCAQIGNCPQGASYAIRQTIISGGGTVEYFDTLGRSIRKGKISFDGDWVYTDTEYDNLGRVRRVSEPFEYSFAQKYWHTSDYDILGRPWRVITADGTQQTMSYQGLSVITVNHFGQRNTETKNVLDQLVTVEDHLGGRIGYQYNIDGELTHLLSYRAGETSPAATTVLEYDSLGRKIRMDDPDKGTWYYQYNAFGELIQQMDAKGQVVTQVYDQLGRMTSRTDYLTSSLTAIEGYTYWLYDNSTTTDLQVDNSRGQLREVVYSQGTVNNSCFGAATVQCVQYSYDEFGRQAATDIRLGAGGSLGSYTTQVEYDQYGRSEYVYDVLNGAINLSGSGTSGVQTRYNNYGYGYQQVDLQTGDALHTINERDARNQVITETRSNGATTHYQYDPVNGRLLQQTTTDAIGLTAIQGILYQWDALGNLISRHNQSADGQGGQKNLQESFCYDGLNRLIKTHQGTTSDLCSGVTASQQDVRYDSLGNIIYKHDVGSYTYAHVNNTTAVNDAGLHAVTATSDGYTYQYDNNGNMIADTQSGSTGRTLHYTTFDKPDEIIKGDHTTRFAYGYDRSRYWRQDTDSNGVVTTTLYLGGIERISRSNSTQIIWKRYLGHSIITVNTDASGNTQSRDERYVYKDHLGSTDVITDISGTVIQSMSFDPWGQRRNASNWAGFSVIQLVNFDHSESTKGFTGHEHLDEVGLIHMNGRIYDPRLARFLQADPHIQAPADTQMLNRYSYTRNNPLNATDPSGFISLGNIVHGIMTVAFAAFATAVCGPTCGSAAAAAAIGAGAYTAFMAYAATGSFSAAIQAGVIAGVSTYAFAKIGQHFGKLSVANTAAMEGSGNFGANLYRFGGNTLTPSQIAQQIALHGVVGGVSSHLQGGNFRSGFLSAGLTKGVMGAVNFNYRNTSPGAVLGRTAVAALVGGTVSEVTGGKFANGAVTAAIGHLMNAEGPTTVRQAMKKYEAQYWDRTDTEAVLRFFFGDKINVDLITDWSSAQDLALDMFVSALEADGAITFGLDTAVEEVLPYDKLTDSQLTGEILGEINEGVLSEANFTRRVRDLFYSLTSGPAKSRTDQLNRMWLYGSKQVIRSNNSSRLPNIYD